MPPILQRMRRSGASRTGRALWLALALLVLAVQTGLPAHEASHHLSKPDTLCQYCVLGGHLYSLPSTPPAAVAPRMYREAPHGVFASTIASPFPRTVFSRGPPSVANA
ncbi:MAG TPA: hypothetical protein VGT99_00415 [Gammaproteobacteria bacterium]|nr:hypothetical protein [Gammaproteobacteria bacterium]